MDVQASGYTCQLRVHVSFGFKALSPRCVGPPRLWSPLPSTRFDCKALGSLGLLPPVYPVLGAEFRSFLLGRGVVPTPRLDEGLSRTPSVELVTPLSIREACRSVPEVELHVAYPARHVFPGVA